MNIRKLMPICFTIVLQLSMQGQVVLRQADDYKPDQDEESNYHMFGINIGYGYEIPGGDLSSRYGDNLKVVMGLGYLTPRNYIWEGEFGLMFGSTVKEDVLANLRTPNGSIISVNGGLSDVFTRQRGFFLGAIFGKLIPVDNRQSGVRIAGGLGILSHNVRINDEGDPVIQLRGNYAKGYDRLTRGWATKQQIGYEYHSKSKRINLNLLFEFTQGFTSNVRQYQFDIGPMSQDRRLDLIYSVRATWMIPLYKQSEVEQTIYY